MCMETGLYFIGWEMVTQERERERKKDCIRTITKPFVIHIILLLLSDSLCFSFWTADSIVVLYSLNIALAFIDTRKSSTLHEVSLTLVPYYSFTPNSNKKAALRDLYKREFSMLLMRKFICISSHTQTLTQTNFMSSVSNSIYFIVLYPCHSSIVDTAHFCPLPWCALICIGYVYFYFLFMMF